jgi:formamidopyrimidine-DNA glycosylase
MPELPDVEIFKQLVEQNCLGRIIARVDVADPGIVEGVSIADLHRRLRGSGVRGCRRYGKHLIIDCGDAGSLAMHFGTNGSLRLIADAQPDLPYVRLTLVFQGGDRLAYINPRRIGCVRLVDSAAAFIAGADLGPDALDRAWDEAAFSALLAARSQPIKTVLMDQSRVAGIGNIYSDEILFQAGLHPGIVAATLDRDGSRRLFQVMRSVLRTAIECGAGAEGFTDKLPKDFLLPERHAGGRCPRCGGAIEAVRRGGRSGYFCPMCQPGPGQRSRSAGSLRKGGHSRAA